MKTGIKFILSITGIIIIPIALYIGYLWATYIDDPVIEGSAYGFEIGTTKETTYSDVSYLWNKHPHLIIYITYGPRAGDIKMLTPTEELYYKVEPHDEWLLLLDGKGEFWNNIRLTFEDGKLAIIRRHRQNFELP